MMEHQDKDPAFSLTGRIVVITGAARGLGFEYARLLSSLGAAVVINDLHGSQAAAAKLCNDGGKASGYDANAADWHAARGLIAHAIDMFGGLDVLVNNAGLLRVARVWDLSEDDWDGMLDANLKSMVAPTRAAMLYWLAESRAGRPRRASLINTTSETGLVGNPGRAAYGAAKAATANLTLCLATELESIGVRVNAIAPIARTEMSQQTEQIRAFMTAPADPASLDVWDPRHVAPLVAYLALADCQTSGKVIQIRGGAINSYDGWRRADLVSSDSPWTLADLARIVPDLSTDGAIDQQFRHNLLAALQ